MSLSAREEHILGSIEDGLARSDHKLAWMLAAFTRLASGEDLPAREKVRPVRPGADLRGRRHRHRDGARRRARRLCQRLGLPRYRGLWLAAAAVALVTIALAVSHPGSGSGRGSCTTRWSASCAAQAPAHPPGSGAHKAASGQSPHAG